jgi:hypothetical protein
MDLPLFSQLHLGKGSGSAAPRELGRRASALEAMIHRARELAGLDGLMIWTDHDLPLYRALAQACRDCGVAPYLWFAVLADVQGAPLAEGDLQVRYDGSRGHGRIGAWRGLGTGGEDFLFLCPNREGPLRRVLQAFERLLDEVGFEGVMLDRIRYPSAVNGFESLFGCFCPDCEREYAARSGVPLAEQREAVAAFLARLAGTQWSQAAKWGSFASLWKEAGLEELFDFKKRSITRVVRRFAELARRRGLKVGLDLYSYSLAPLVAQDYGELAGTCDWLKTMSYCHAVGPAGLPLELACLQEAFASLCPGLSPGEAHRLLRGLMGWRWPQSSERLLRQGLDEQTLGVELDRIASDPAAGAARVFAGFEAVRLPEFGVDITAEVLRRYLAQAVPRAAGLVASWNLPDIPEENLRVLGERKRTA